MEWQRIRDCCRSVLNNEANWAQSRSLPAGDVFRARLILALANGMSDREIERKVGASAPTVSKWKSRFEQEGMEGLQGR